MFQSKAFASDWEVQKYSLTGQKLEFPQPIWISDKAQFQSICRLINELLRIKSQERLSVSLLVERIDKVFRNKSTNIVQQSLPTRFEGQSQTPGNAKFDYSYPAVAQSLEKRASVASETADSSPDNTIEANAGDSIDVESPLPTTENESFEMERINHLVTANISSLIAILATLKDTGKRVVFLWKNQKLIWSFRYPDDAAIVAPCFSADEEYFACYDGKESIFILRLSWSHLSFQAECVAQVQVLGLPVPEYGSRMKACYHPIGLRAFSVGVKASRIVAAIEYRQCPRNQIGGHIDHGRVNQKGNDTIKVSNLDEIAVPVSSAHRRPNTNSILSSVHLIKKNEYHDGSIVTLVLSDEIGIVIVCIDNKKDMLLRRFEYDYSSIGDFEYGTNGVYATTGAFLKVPSLVRRGWFWALFRQAGRKYISLSFTPNDYPCEIKTLGDYELNSKDEPFDVTLGEYDWPYFVRWMAAGLGRIDWRLEVNQHWSDAECWFSGVYKKGDRFFYDRGCLSVLSSRGEFRSFKTSNRPIYKIVV
jgi:hypothetical protein